MIGYDELLPEIQMHIACNTDGPMIVACRTAARELFHKSLVWRSDLQQIKERTGRIEYTMELAQDTELVGVVAMLRGSDALTPIGRVDLEESKGRIGIPHGYYREGLVLYLSASPEPTSIIKPVVQLKPSADSVGIENDYYANKFRDVIVAGAVANLAAMPGKTWSAPSVYGVHRAKFEEGIAEATREARRYTDGRPRFIEYPYSSRQFAGYSRRGSNGRY